MKITYIKKTVVTELVEIDDSEKVIDDECLRTVHGIDGERIKEMTIIEKLEYLECGHLEDTADQLGATELDDSNIEVVGTIEIIDVNP